MARTNRVIKPQDIVILGYLITRKRWPTQMETSNSLEISQAEVSNALKTLEQVGLINLTTKKINNLAVTEFIVHAVKFLFPIEKEGIGRGVLIGPSFSVFRNKVQSEEYDYIWPDPNGDSKGIIVRPLLESIAKSTKENENLFLFLNIVEIFRGLGGVRHNQEAHKLLKELLL